MEANDIPKLKFMIQN